MSKRLRKPNAFIAYWFLDDTGALHSPKVPLWVMSFKQEFGLSGQSYQALKYQHYYAKSNSTGPLIVQGRVPDQDYYDRLTDHIRAHHKLLINRRGYSNLAGEPQDISLMRLSVQGENLNVDGIITEFEAGAKRFNPAPPFTFEMLVVNDHGSLNNDIRVGHVIHNLFFNGTIDAVDIDTSLLDTSLSTLDESYSDSPTTATHDTRGMRGPL